MFYKVKDTCWQKDFGEGVPFWRGLRPPKGNIPNSRAPSQEAKLPAREKVFKLKFNGYLEQKDVVLIIPCFLVPKVEENRVVKDVRCMWDYIR